MIKGVFNSKQTKYLHLIMGYIMKVLISDWLKWSGVVRLVGRENSQYEVLYDYTRYDIRLLYHFAWYVYIYSGLLTIHLCSIRFPTMVSISQLHATKYDVNKP